MSTLHTRGTGTVMEAVEHVQKKRRQTFNRSEKRKLESTKWRKKFGAPSPAKGAEDEQRRLRKDRRLRRRREKEARRRQRG